MTSKRIHIGDASIALDAYAISGTALLGIRGSGKTWTGKGIAEQLLDHQVPIIAFDPIGVWRYLKVPAAKNGKGYPVVVAGGRGADLALTPQTAQEIVRAAMRENISLVVDLYDKTLSKADWRRIVQTCFRTLLYENEGMRHIFLEEAAEYCPQKVQDGETYAEVEKLVRMGGNASLGITLINQRAQEVNKAVLDLCENLVLMRQMGAHAIDALEKWIDKVSPDFAGKIAAGMPKMQAGECWVFAGGAEKPVHTRSGAIRTFHPDRKKPDAKVSGAATDTSSFVEAMQRALPAIVEQQNANDPKKLRAEIARLNALNAELGKANQGLQSNTTQVSTEVYRQRIATIEADNRALEQHRDDLVTYSNQLRDAAASARNALVQIRDRAEGLLATWMPIEPLPLTKPSAPAPAARPHTGAHLQRPAAVSAPRTSRVNGGGDPALTGGARVILTAIAQHPDGCDQTQIAVLTGYKSTSRKVFIGQLRRAGYLTGSWPERVTDDGMHALGDSFEPLPTGRALRDYWLDKLDGGERTLFEALCQAYPRTMSAAELEQAGEYKSTSRKVFLQRLKARKIVEKRNGEFIASERLF